MSFYSIDGINSKCVARKEYKVKNQDLVLYQAPQCVEGILNVFFTGPVVVEEGEPIPDKKFGLYCLPIELAVSSYDVGKAKHIYNIEDEFLTHLKVETVNKECYLLNLGQKIMMFKRGYMVDTAVVNYQINDTYLRMYSDCKVVFITPSNIDMYNLSIDLLANPPKIALKSTDSIMVEQSSSYQFLDVLRLDTMKYAFFYQIPIGNGSGEVQYQFFITIPMKFEEKVNSILPKVS